MTSARSRWNSVRRANRCTASLLAAALAAGCVERLPEPIAAPLGLPVVAVPADNPPTVAKAELGRKLFFDRRLSANGTMSCAMCHIPEQGWTSNELATPVGIAGRSVRRNAPTLLNVAYHPRLFHDGRDGALETQILGPLLAANEMGNASIEQVAETLRAQADYRGLFESAFGRGPGADTIGMALASFERTLASGHSRFDRYRYGGEPSALGAEEKLGYQVFLGKGRCAGCHLIGERAALLSDFRYHNTGIGWLRARGLARVRVELAPGSATELTPAEIAGFGEPDAADDGRFEVTRAPTDRWAYKTPSLRNVALTAPYMHDGSLVTLEAVIDYYDRGGAGAPGQSPLIAPLALTDAEKRALAAFLGTLTGDNVERLARRATAR